MYTDHYQTFIFHALSHYQSINQSINKFILRHSTEVHATVQLCQIKEKYLKTDLKCVNGWSSSTVQWKRVPEIKLHKHLTICSSISFIFFYKFPPLLFDCTYLLIVSYIAVYVFIMYCMVLRPQDWINTTTSNISFVFCPQNFIRPWFKWKDETRVATNNREIWGLSL